MTLFSGIVDPSQLLRFFQYPFPLVSCDEGTFKYLDFFARVLHLQASDRRPQTHDDLDVSFSDPDGEMSWTETFLKFLRELISKWLSGAPAAVPRNTVILRMLDLPVLLPFFSQHLKPEAASHLFTLVRWPWFLGFLVSLQLLRRLFFSRGFLPLF